MSEIELRSSLNLMAQTHLSHPKAQHHGGHRVKLSACKPVPPLWRATLARNEPLSLLAPIRPCGPGWVGHESKHLQVSIAFNAHITCAMRLARVMQLHPSIFIHESSGYQYFGFKTVNYITYNALYSHPCELSVGPVSTQVSLPVLPRALNTAVPLSLSF